MHEVIVNSAYTLFHLVNVLMYTYDKVVHLSGNTIALTLTTFAPEINGWTLAFSTSLSPMQSDQVLLIPLTTEIDSHFC